MKNLTVEKSKIQEIANEVLESEVESILLLKSSLGEDFLLALDKMKSCEGKIIVTGMGKSGIVGRKFAATLSSTGTPAIYMHPSEASHGDLGVIGSNDLVFTLSYGGESSELKDLFSYCKRKGVEIIAMTGNSESELARNSDVTLLFEVKREAGPLGLAPTTSSTVSLVYCDMLAMCLLDLKGFQETDFAEVHPGGSLGRRLLTKVEDVMNVDFPVVSLEENLVDVLELMTTRKVRGICGVVSHDKLVGVITDGDLRRFLRQNMVGSQDLKATLAKDIMSENPKTLNKDELAQKALFLMDQFQIQCLFVTDKKNPQIPVGLIHFQDLLEAKIT